MNARLVKTYLTTTCLLTSALFTGLVIADWSGDRQLKSINPGYGDFPPEDIEEQLQDKLQDNASRSTEPAVESNQGKTNQPVSSPTQQYPTQEHSTQKLPTQQNTGYQGAYPSANTGNTAPGYSTGYSSGRANQAAPYRPYPDNIASRRAWDNRSRMGGPWNGRNSGFSGPWNNRGSSFSGPWNNRRGSSYSGPWNNNGSSFSGPWNNNSSGFTMPWGNNNRGSGFSPWGNGGGMSW